MLPPQKARLHHPGQSSPAMVGRRLPRPRPIQPVQDHKIARRNARERDRVAKINVAFERLAEALRREAIPESLRNQKISKLTTLRTAITHLGELGTKLGEPVAAGPAAAPEAPRRPPPLTDTAPSPSLPPAQLAHHPRDDSLRDIIAAQQQEMDALRNVTRSLELRAERQMEESIKNRATRDRAERQLSASIKARLTESASGLAPATGAQPTPTPPQKHGVPTILAKRDPTA